MPHLAKMLRALAGRRLTTAGVAADWGAWGMLEHEMIEGDALILRLDPAGPVTVDDLTASLGGLARIYERHYRPQGGPAPRLYITKIETGSIIATITPYAVLLGSIVTAMDTALIIGDFTRRVSSALKAFAGHPTAPDTATTDVTFEDAADLREFIKPITGRKGASLGLRHARFLRESKDARVEAEYIFDDAEINRARSNIENHLLEPPQVDLKAEPTKESPAYLEVPLIVEKASRGPGKQKGRTDDRAIVEQIYPKPLPVYFRKSVQNLKERMMRGMVNPLSNTIFIVDLYVVRVDGAPQSYVVTNVHAALPFNDEEGSALE